ncbi:MAG: hypothetical protein QOH05_523 [Acetobacteraceae bacterium]|nr:hypothetical protein [Acetobacteraceae bacterium]
MSAVAAISGLLLLGLAFYGQPALYLHQAREQWDALLDAPAADQATEPDHDAATERMARLQQQVSQLEDELAARQAAAKAAAEATAVTSAPPSVGPLASAPQAAEPPSAPPQVASRAPASQTVAPQAAAPQAVAPQTVAPEAAAPQAAAPQAAPPQAEPPKIVIQQLPPPSSGPAQPETAQSASGQPGAPQIGTGPSTEQRFAAREPASPPSDMPGAELLPRTAEPPTQHVRPGGPERTETATAEPVAPRRGPPKAEQPQPVAANPEPARPEPARPEPARPEPTRAEPTRAELARVEPARPAPQRIALPKPPPLPRAAPPSQQASATRQETDDAQSVLARLRQMAPASAPPQQAAVVPPTMDPRPRQPPSPALPKLAAARAALGNGRIEEARRLLQETQLQLVFRPYNAAGDDTPSAGKGAADVAHALDALSANDVSLSRRYVDVALNDLSGSGTTPSVQESQLRPSGYAPAYPPR